MKYLYQSIFIVALILVFSCEEEVKQERSVKETLFTELPPSETGIDFKNALENQKNFNIFNYRNFYNGGGVAIGDINNDGLSDIFFSANMKANRLFLNKGDFKFEDISASAGIEGNKPWSTGVNMVDINNDGFLDIYVSHAGHMEGNNHDNELYINNGDLTFSEKAEEYNLARTGFSIHASFFDYDKDGDLDAYILNNSNIPVTSLGYADQRGLRAEDWDVPEIFSGPGDMLLRNDDGYFTDVSNEAGIYGSLIGFGLSVLITDINEDLYPDIYITNDFYERDYLYINNQDGTFTEDIKNWASHLTLSAMGVDVADINNDGLGDIFVTDMLPEEDQRIKSVMEFEGYNVFRLKQSKDFYQQYIQNTLQLNNGNGSFSEIAYFSGVSATDWSWSTLMFDMDNDGYRDIFVANGIYHDLTDLDFMDFFANEIIQDMALTGKKEAIDSIIEKMPTVPLPNYAFRNNKDLTFDNKAEEWGLGIPSMSNGAAYGDLDNDGDLDLVVNNVNMQAFVYRNNSREQTGNNFIKLKFEGSEKNPFAIGTKIKLYYDDRVVMQELVPFRGFQSSMEYDMTIGLGKAGQIDSLHVIWPDDKFSKLTALRVNETTVLKQADATLNFQLPKAKEQPKLLNELSNEELVAHAENPYNDFDYEGLINQLLSQEGPALAVGDVNGDGNEDVFVGGASGQASAIYLHLGGGELELFISPVFNDDLLFEDTAAAFLDADSDGDLDLLVGSGGNEVEKDRYFKNRLYLNNGKGVFSKSDQEIPSTRHNVSAILPNDYDGDGDMDVVITSRSVVGVYGIDPTHLFLENQGDGSFKDSTERIAFELKNAGMVTSGTWADINNDDLADLVTVSEWGSPVVYLNNGRRLNKWDCDLDEFTGWWLTVEAADLDGDGDPDLILGNHGKNIHYRPGKDNPLKMWINDFDNNGTIEQVMTQSINGKDYPLHQKREILNQMVSLKKKNLKASEYASKTIQDLFSEEVLTNTIMKEVRYSASSIAINEGNGKFTLVELPPQAQLSCLCGIACADINSDGHLDLVMGGNNYEFKPQYSRQDSNYGTVLINDGNLNFKWKNYDETGLFIKGEIKHLKLFKDKNQNAYIISGINNDKPRIYSLNK